METNALKEFVEKLLARIEVLEAENAELRRRLGMNSDNSSKPPGSEGLEKKPVRKPVSLRTKSGKKSGGQDGHDGTTLRKQEQPDKIEDHYPTACVGCGHALGAEHATEHQARQVFDMPMPQPLECTEHRAHSSICPHCAQTTQGVFPEGVTAPVQYGNNLASFAVYLSIEHHIPEERVVEIIKELYGVTLASDTIANMRRAKATAFKGFVEALEEAIKRAPVKHADESGVRTAGCLHWLHVLSTTLMTFYRVTAKRGAVPEGLTGTLVHDCFGPYFAMAGLAHALCNAHLLRELKGLIDNEKEAWAAETFRFLQLVCHAINVSKRKNIPIDPSFAAYIEARYDRLVAQGLAYHEALPPLETAVKPNGKRRRGKPKHRIGHNLLFRLRDHKNAVLRCVKDPAVPFTNNQAEQDVRMIKVHQKVSGCFRSLSGAEVFATLRSVTSTAKKQGWNVLATLSNLFPHTLIPVLSRG